MRCRLVLAALAGVAGLTPTTTLTPVPPDCVLGSNTVLTALSGTLAMSGIGLGDCSWHIQPWRKLGAIEFNVTRADFGTPSTALSFYSSSYHSDLVGRFYQFKPPPPFMQLSGSDEAVLVLNSRSDSARSSFIIHYECILEDVGGLDLIGISPLWLTLWMGAWTLLISTCCASAYWLLRARKRRLRRILGLAARSSDALSMRHLDGLEHGALQERREAAEVLEVRVAAALGELRVCSYADRRAGRAGKPPPFDASKPASAGAPAGAPSGAPAGAPVNGGAELATAPPEPAADERQPAAPEEAEAEEDECCLCMEAFEADDELRLLPCGHDFHPACIDRWFAARAYRPRTCPLCKRDPLAGVELGRAAAQAVARAGGVAALLGYVSPLGPSRGLAAAPDAGPADDAAYSAYAAEGVDRRGWDAARGEPEGIELGEMGEVGELGELGELGGPQLARVLAETPPPDAEELERAIERALLGVGQAFADEGGEPVAASAV